MKKSVAFFALFPLVIALMLSPLRLMADPVAGLYSAKTPVPDQSVTARDEAIKAAFAKVLIKVTGDSKAPMRPGMAQKVAKAANYVSQYAYQQVGSRKLLRVDFAQNAMNEMLKARQVQLWPVDRQPLLVWMVVDTEQAGTQFATPANQPSAIGVLRALMNGRGAPLLLPMYDAMDATNLTEEQAWQLEPSHVSVASQRYGREDWMVLRCFQRAGGDWQGARLLKVKGRTSSQSATASSLPELIVALIPSAVDDYAKRYAYVPKYTAKNVAVNLTNVYDFAEYQRATRYFQSLQLVKEVVVQRVSAGELSLMLKVQGRTDLLVDTLRRDTRLQELEGFDDSGQYRFRWGSY